MKKLHSGLFFRFVYVGAHVVGNLGLQILICRVLISLLGFGLRLIGVFFGAEIGLIELALSELIHGGLVFSLLKKDEIPHEALILAEQHVAVHRNPRVPSNDEDDFRTLDPNVEVQQTVEDMEIPNYSPGFLSRGLDALFKWFVPPKFSVEKPLGIHADKSVPLLTVKIEPLSGWQSFMQFISLHFITSEDPMDVKLRHFLSNNTGLKPSNIDDVEELVLILEELTEQVSKDVDLTSEYYDLLVHLRSKLTRVMSNEPFTLNSVQYSKEEGLNNINTIVVRIKAQIEDHSKSLVIVNSADEGLVGTIDDIPLITSEILHDKYLDHLRSCNQAYITEHLESNACKAMYSKCSEKNSGVQAVGFAKSQIRKIKAIGNLVSEELAFVSELQAKLPAKCITEGDKKTTAWVLTEIKYFNKYRTTIQVLGYSDFGAKAKGSKLVFNMSLNSDLSQEFLKCRKEASGLQALLIEYLCTRYKELLDMKAVWEPKKYLRHEAYIRYYLLEIKDWGKTSLK